MRVLASASRRCNLVAGGLPCFQIIDERLQVEHQILHRLVPMRAILSERLGDNAVQLRRHMRLEPGQRVRFTIENRRQNVGAAWTLEWNASGHHLVQHNAQ